MIDVNNETDARLDEAEFAPLATYVLGEMHVSADAELAILFVDEQAMEELHIKWMDEPGATDVLSFPMDELRPGTSDQPTPAGLSRRHRRVPGGGGRARRRPRATRPRRRCCC